MTTLITGGTGNLGKQLVNVFPESVHPSRAELDITQHEAVSTFIRRARPSMIIHTAALTGVRECEEKTELAWATNVRGTENLVSGCELFSPDCYFVHISTACVFRGDKGGYTESDVPYPKNFYSLTKLLSEFIVAKSSLERCLIVRTNFVGRQKWPYSRAFVDRFGTYLFADDLANALQNVISDGITGTAHLAGDQKLSMYELARITTPKVEPMTLDEYHGPPLTVDMSLRSNRLGPFKLTRGRRLSKGKE